MRAVFPLTERKSWSSSSPRDFATSLSKDIFFAVENGNNRSYLTTASDGLRVWKSSLEAIRKTGSKAHGRQMPRDWTRNVERDRGIHSSATIFMHISVDDDEGKGRNWDVRLLLGGDGWRRRHDTCVSRIPHRRIRQKPCDVRNEASTNTCWKRMMRRVGRSLWI